MKRSTHVFMFFSVSLRLCGQLFKSLSQRAVTLFKQFSVSLRLCGQLLRSLSQRAVTLFKQFSVSLCLCGQLLRSLSQRAVTLFKQFSVSLCLCGLLLKRLSQCAVPLFKQFSVSLCLCGLLLGCMPQFIKHDVPAEKQAETVKDTPPTDMDISRDVKPDPLKEVSKKVEVSQIRSSAPAQPKPAPMAPALPVTTPERTAGTDTVVRPPLPIREDMKIEFLDFKNTDIQDVIRAVAQSYRINVWVAPDVKKNVTINFNNIAVRDAMEFLILENGFDYRVENSVIKVMKPAEKPPEPKVEAPVNIAYAEGMISFDLKEADLEKVVRKLSVLTGENILMDRSLSGTVSGFIRNVPFEEGVQILMENNGYVFRRVKNVYRIEKTPWESSDSGGRDGGRSSARGGRMLAVTVDEHGMVSMDVFNASINNVLQEISRQSGIDIFIYGRVDGSISARCAALSVDGALDYLFRGTEYIFTKKDHIYFVGRKDIQGITSTELIRLNHMKAEGIIEMLPESITSKATLKIIKEHNGIVAIGSYDIIRELKDFITQIDQPVAQVLIEAIVVDFKTDKIKSEGVEVFLGDQDTSRSMLRRFFPGLSTMMDDTEGNHYLKKIENLLNIKKIGRLPRDFFMTLSALEKRELAKVISRPQIATLNGHSASITVGTTQYFLLKKESTTPTSGTTTTQTTEEFKTIQADMTLQVTPWVSAAGEITTEIAPSFNTPRSSLDASVPPTIDRRELSSTVRLRDGETIILGGLIRTTEDKSRSEFPWLGRIPWIGRLFRTENVTRNQSEMIVYLTPHLYYGSEGSVEVKDVEFD